jgi:muconate cycloisomerase
VKNIIKRIELTPVFVPFKHNIKQVMQTSDSGVGMAIKVEEEWLGGDFVVCKLVDNEGNVGLGEVFVWLPETGISPDCIINIIERALANYILDESPFNYEKILYRMNNNVSRNEVAKGLLDMACYDLMGKITGHPAYDFMGGKSVDEIPLAALVPLTDDVETTVMIAKSFKKLGFKTLRYKLGNGIQEDVEISENIRNEVGSDIRLRVDYNQAYTPSEAVKAIDAIEEFIDVAEQPVAAEDYLGMVYVQERVNVPLMAHEGCFSLRDFITLAELGAVECLGVNSERPGGVTNAIRAIEYAKMKGFGTIIHNQPLGISSAMHIHLAVAKYYSLGHAMELFGHIMMEDDLIKDPIDYSKGIAKLPQGAGWGVRLDEESLEKYKTSETVIIKNS